MSPLFMETGYESNSPSSLSAEETHSNTAGSEREGEGQPTGGRVTKRQEKNRNAARKSRRKQTERADELHEELQSLEQSNSALHKEIALLKKDLQLYTTALKRHEPFCSLRDSKACLSVSPPTNCQTSSSPPRVPPQASTQAASPSLSTSLTSTLGLQALKSLESPHLSSSTPTTLASSTASSSELFTRSSSVTAPYSVSFSAVSAPHSLFSDDPPSLIRSRPTNVTPVCTGLFSNPAPSSSLTTAAWPQSRRGDIYDRSSMSEKACFSTYNPASSFRSASFKEASPYSNLAPENAGLEAQGCPMNVAQLHSGHFTGNPINSSLPHSLLPSTLQDPALQSSSVSNPELSLASKPINSRHVAPNPASLLSLLTVPSPLTVSQTTSSSFGGPLSQPLPSLPPLGDPLRDLSLSELLEVNDWILQ